MKSNLFFFWRVRKVANSDYVCCVTSVCLSTRNNSATIEQTFMKFDKNIIRKFVEKIQVSLKFDNNNNNNNRHFTWKRMYIYHHISLICFRQKLLRNRNKFKFKNFFSDIVPFMRYGKKTVQPYRPQMAIWCMRIAYWITKATNIHSEYMCLNYCISM